MSRHKTNEISERYDRVLKYARDSRLPVGTPRPRPTACWPDVNNELLERFHRWLVQGGASEAEVKTIYLPMAGHVLGLNLKPHGEITLDEDLEKALTFVKAKGASKHWLKSCRNGLHLFRRFLRQERGLGEECKGTPFDPARITDGFPEWLVKGLERYQHLRQWSWSDAKVEENVRRFWCGHSKIWRFLINDRGVQQISDLKRQHVLDYVDHRLKKGCAVSGVNTELRTFRAFLLFLQDEGYTVHRLYSTSLG